ncbi:MAG: hypothetical protein K8S16_01190 [Bacteroidales bacterium]|nr:hypothetical protein [Bacteroidales bacterium]
MDNTLNNLYESRREMYAERLNRSARRSRNMSYFRLADFVLAMFLVYIFARYNSPAGIIISIFITLGIFLYLVKKHSSILTQKKLEKAYVEINENELSALSGKVDINPDGKNYIDNHHPYSDDLDVFGVGSLFQYVNRSASIIGNDRLAQMMEQPENNVDEIRRTQDMVRNLSGLLDWRQDFMAIGRVFKEIKDDDQKIIEWSQKKPLFGNTIFLILSFIIPVLSFTMAILLSLNLVSVQQFFLYLVLPWGISGFSAIKVNTRHMMVSRTSEMLKKYSLLLNLVEKVDATVPKLNEIKKVLGTEKNSAGLKLKKLASILTALDNRLNFVSWALLNGLLLWDIMQMIRLERWQAKYMGDVKKWFDVIAQVDALNSVANFAFNHPDAVYPDIYSGPFEMNAKNLGHPLIPNNQRIANDFNIKKGEFVIVTGANMAGKSTFLRTVGINLILGMIGAPVCAAEIRFSPISVYTSIRTKDSLLKNESYFYAELKRLKAIIDELKEGRELFVILDEILKGTNSKDKHAGSEALLNQLLSLNATGIVATHDVALGSLEDVFPKQVKNLCFEVDINDGQLFFDYKIRPGISRNMNATFLMREMGITV